MSNKVNYEIDDSEFLEKDIQRRAGEIVYKKQLEEFEKEADSGKFKIMRMIVEAIGAFALVGYIMFDLWTSSTNGIGKIVVITIVLLAVSTFVFRAIARHYYLQGKMKKFKVANTISKVSELSVAIADAATPGGERTVDRIKKTQSAVKNVVSSTSKLSVIDDDESIFLSADYDSYRTKCYRDGISMYYNGTIDMCMRNTRNKLKTSKQLPHEYRRDVILLCYIVRDYSSHSVPKEIVTDDMYYEILGALYYFSDDKVRLNVIPNFVPGLGYTDDMFMCNCVIAKNTYNIRAYKIWRMELKKSMKDSRDKEILNELSNMGEEALVSKRKELTSAVDGDMTWDSQDVGNMFAMVKSYLRGEYKLVPYGTIIIAVGAVAYWVLPNDFVPDKMPGIGKVDDAFVMGIAACGIKSDLNDFVKWSNECKGKEPRVAVNSDVDSALEALRKV